MYIYVHTHTHTHIYIYIYILMIYVYIYISTHIDTRFRVVVRPLGAAPAVHGGLQTPLRGQGQGTLSSLSLSKLVLSDTQVYEP